MHFDSTITLGNVVESIIFLGVVIKTYGDWRILKERLDILWKDYLVRHNISTE